MLAPDDVIAVHEALRPPVGMRLDVGVGTTYSLDLLALLTAPVAFAMFDIQRTDDPGTLSSLAVLESIRRYADQLTVFCQAGAISVPSSYRQALTWAESTVVEVRRPTPSGVFHPKVWALRFTNGESHHHRVVVLSRNLTFDRSLDVVVTLDEDPNASPGAATAMGPFLLGLLASPVHPIPASRVEAVTDLAHTMTLARLVPPKPFRDAVIWPLGGPAGLGMPYLAHPARTLVVSPFLTGSTLDDIIGESPATLISTTDAIDGLTDKQRQRFDMRYVLASTELASEAGTLAPPVADPAADPEAGPAVVQPRGLHAKIVISDAPGRPKSSRWVLGSPNATHHAHHQNVELAVVMNGPTTSCGVAAVLTAGTEGRDSVTLVDLLEPYDPDPGTQGPEIDDAEDLLHQMLTDIACGGVTMCIGDRGDDGRYPATLTVQTPPSPSAGATLTARPLSLRHESHAHSIDAAGNAAWDGIALENITPFVVLTATTTDGSSSRARIVVASLEGAPEHRRERILARALQSTEDFLRYLLLLLGDAGADPEAWSKSVSDAFIKRGGPRGTAQRGWHADFPILEVVLRSAASDPGSLRYIRGLVDDLRRADAGDVIPPDFDALWSAVEEAVGVKPA